MPRTDRLLFALALESLPGVGKVTVGRVLDHFDTLADLRTYPRASTRSSTGCSTPRR